MPSGKSYGFPSAKFQFWTTFRHLKKFSYRKTYGRVSQAGNDNFGRFRDLRKCIKSSGLRFTKYQFWTTFRQLKKFFCVKLIVRSHGREVTIFGHVGVWERIMPSGKAYMLPFAKYNFWKTFRQLKIFRTVKINGRSPGREMTIFEMCQSLRKRIEPSGKV